MPGICKHLLLRCYPWISTAFQGKLRAQKSECVCVVSEGSWPQSQELQPDALAATEPRAVGKRRFARSSPRRTLDSVSFPRPAGSGARRARAGAAGAAGVTHRGRDGAGRGGHVGCI